MRPSVTALTQWAQHTTRIPHTARIMIHEQSSVVSSETPTHRLFVSISAVDIQYIIALFKIFHGFALLFCNLLAVYFQDRSRLHAYSQDMVV